jgi:uncharacterized protein YndB with AHSA1/START domain
METTTPVPVRKRSRMFYVLLGFAAVVVVLAVVISLRPSDFHVERSLTMAASPARVFEEVNNLHQWEAWSPWAKRDPNMKKSYEGPEAGAGAVYHWDGNAEVGSGNVTIAESHPDKRIGIRLVMVRPFACDNAVEFTFQPQGDQTVVTWGMDGKYNFITKAMGLFMSMDRMIGGDFEQGLTSLKTIVESPGAM